MWLSGGSAHNDISRFLHLQIGIVAKLLGHRVTSYCINQGLSTTAYAMFHYTVDGGAREEGKGGTSSALNLAEHIIQQNPSLNYDGNMSSLA